MDLHHLRKICSDRRIRTGYLWGRDHHHDRSQFESAEQKAKNERANDVQIDDMNQERLMDIATSEISEKAKMAGTAREETRDRVDVRREVHMEKSDGDIAEDHHKMGHVRILHLESMVVVTREDREQLEEDLELGVKTRDLDVVNDCCIRVARPSEILSR
jgi:hypothetical protein